MNAVDQYFSEETDIIFEHISENKADIQCSIQHYIP